MYGFKDLTLYNFEIPLVSYNLARPVLHLLSVGQRMCLELRLWRGWSFQSQHLKSLLESGGGLTRIYTG